MTSPWFAEKKSGALSEAPAPRRALLPEERSSASGSSPSDNAIEMDILLYFILNYEMFKYLSSIESRAGCTGTRTGSPAG